MKLVLTFVLVISTIIFIFIGGVIIHNLEYDYENETRSEISRHFDQTLQQFICMTTICYFCVAYEIINAAV